MRKFLVLAMVVAHLLRLSGHGEHDDGSYVPRENREDHYGRDCIDIATRQLIDHGLATEEEIKSWHQQFADEVQRAVAQAQQEAVPDPYHEDWSALSSRISAAHQSPNPTAQPS